METVRARLIPSIERLRQSPRAQALEALYGRDAVVDALRAAAAGLRAALQESAASTPVPDARDRTPGDADRDIAAPGDADRIGAMILDAADLRLTERLRSRLVPVINATSGRCEGSGP